jgi:hypothetical protein
MLAACAPLGLLLAGCGSAHNAQFFRSGIGTDLYHPSLAETTRLQDAYVDNICRQAGVVVDLNGREVCSDWTSFVQAGMNDIDQRCDAYLAWLDDRRRAREPVLQQISDLRTATVAILAATGVGVDPIAIVSAAFGLASSTYTNFSSRLLVELDHSTVQSVVLNRQTTFREKLQTEIFNNRPAAIHALRSYLRICMPYTIEMEINTTVTAFELGGTRALEELRSRASFVPARPAPPPGRRPRGVAIVVDEVSKQCPANDSVCLRLARYIAPTGRINSERRAILQRLAAAIRPELANEVIRVIISPQRMAERTRLLELLQADQPGAVP